MNTYLFTTKHAIDRRIIFIPAIIRLKMMTIASLSDSLDESRHIQLVVWNMPHNAGCPMTSFVRSAGLVGLRVVHHEVVFILPSKHFQTEWYCETCRIEMIYPGK